MRVALIVTGLGMGGAEHVVVNLADALVKQGHKVMIAYLTGEVLVRPQHSNVEMVAIGMSSARNITGAYIKLRHSIRDFKPDVVHSHMVHANILARLLRLSIKMPRLICTAHSINEGGRFRTIAYRLTDRLADISTNVCYEAVAASIAKGAAKKGRVVSIPNGIDLTKFKFDAEARISVRNELNLGANHMLLAVGCLEPPKDYPNLFNAVALLKKKRQDFKLFIVGDGRLKADLETLAKDLGIEQYVIFLGIRRDIPALMSAADTFVLSSAWEGLPLVIGEAMACERAIVATDCGGIKEILGDAGLLVSSGDSVALSNALDQSLSHTAEYRIDVGAKARRRILDEYSLEATVDKYLSLYKS